MTTELAAPSRPRTEGVLTLRGVTRRFGSVTALEGLDLTVRDGEIVALVGPSGCGKTTLLELVAGLQKPDTGAVEVAAPAAYMPQRDLLLPWRDAVGNAALALESVGVPRKEARRRAAPLFERLGLGQFERARPYELSGGMRQRVAFLRTLLSGRPLLLLDEPFGALDAITRASMQDWFAGALQAEPRTVLLVTHDVVEALLLADRVAVLSPRPGRVVTELCVNLPRPRVRRQLVGDPAFAEFERRALEALGC
jgi:ABC-type nitrate/sulfonate/bicarbonate transport system ATPase subunit